MLSLGPSGFSNAPISKGILILVTTCSLLTSIFKIKNVGLEFSGLFENLQIHRIITSQIVFSHTGEMLFGMFLLYFFRLFERQMGSSKFGSFAFLSFLLSLFTELILLLIFRPKDITSGPYGFIFAMFVLYFFDIPVSIRSRVAGFNITDKSFIYLLAIQLLLSKFPLSLIAGVSGILSGLIYRFDVIGIRKFEFPNFVKRFCERFILPLLQSPETQTQISRTRFSSSGQLGARMQAPGTLLGQQNLDQRAFFNSSLFPTTTASSIPLQPREEDITTLTAMGFARNDVIQALAQSNNDLQFATTILIERSN
jgi:membrane associated rhomboid family serine protease